MVARILVLGAMLLATSAFADHNALLVERVNAKFTQAWSTLNETIEAHNYKTAYFQRCDFALKERHYKSDRYRILFFGNGDEMRSMVKKYPQLAPFFPLKITVMEEGVHTLLIATAPIELIPLVNTNKDRMTIFRWHENMKDILKQVKNQYKITRTKP